MPTPAYVRHLHVGSPEFATTGTWTNPASDGTGTSHFGPNQLYKSGPGGTAYWAPFDLPTGSYKVYLTWNSRPPGGSGDGDASAAVGVSVDVGDGAPHSATVDQRHVPVPASGYPDYRDALGREVGWAYVGQYYVTDGMLIVSVASPASGKAWVDGLRIVAADAPLDDRCKAPPRYEDDFQDGSASPSWEHSGGTWSESGGLYRQTASGVAARKARQVYQEWPKRHAEAYARVRVDSWSHGNPACRAGVALNLDASGRGYSLCFDGSSLSTATILLVDDVGGVAATASFSWSVGSWYRFRLRRDGATLRGRVWADGSAEPSTWNVQATIASPIPDRTDGYPGLTAHTPASFDDASFGTPDASASCTAVARTHPTLAASGGFGGEAPASRTGSASPARTHPALAASGGSSPPSRTASASASRHPLLLSSGSFGDTHSGSASPARGRPAASASGGFAVRPKVGSLHERRLLALWKFEEPSGLIFSDSSGNGRTGVASAGTSHGFGGPQGYYATLGAGGRIAFPSTPLGDAWTFCCWLSPWSTYGSGTVRRILTTADGRGLLLGEDARLVLSDGVTQEAGTTVIAGWRHVAVAFAAGEARLYVDGVLEVEGGGWSLGGLSVSSLFSASTSYFGSIDDARIYGEALTGDDVARVRSLALDEARRVPHALAAAGSSAPPSFSGSLARTTTPRKLASAATDGQSHGTASGKAPKRTLATLGVYRYVLTGNGSVERRPLLLAEGTGFMPGLLPLRISGSDGWNSVARAPLAVRGHEASDAAVTLAIHASSPLNAAWAPLVVRSTGVVATPGSGLPIAIVGASPAILPAALSLALHGDAGDGAYRALTAFVRGSAGRSTGVLGLALRCGDEVPLGILPLAVRGGGPRVSGLVPLFTASIPPTTRSLPLSLQAPPGTPGAVPLEGLLNLYCEWGPQGVLPLICGGRSDEAWIPLFAAGGGPVEGSLPLFATGEGGVSQGVLEIAMPACTAPTPCSSEFDLAIPAAHGRSAGVATLALNGWRP